MILRFVFFIFANSILYSQSGYIRGTVLSELSEPLPGANVSIKETGTGAMTDMEGKFSIDGLYPGSYTLNISFIGYKRISKRYVITSDEDGQNFLEKLGLEDASEDDISYGQTFTDLVFKLDPDAVALRQVNVTGHELDKSLSDISKQTIFFRPNCIEVLIAPTTPPAGPERIRSLHFNLESSTSPPLDCIILRGISPVNSFNF